MTGNRIFGFSCANAAGITTLMFPLHFTLKIFASRSHLDIKLSKKLCESLENSLEKKTEHLSLKLA